MSQTILGADHVSYSYGRKGPLVLEDACMDVPQGKKIALLGCNGAGKSTMFSILNALYRPDSGKVLYKGRQLSYRRRDTNRMRSDVSILFQNPNDMIFKPYVEQDVAFGPKNMGLPKDEVERRVEEALLTVGMEKYRKQPIMKLSYGQRKRVTLAGVLAMRPKVLIMDEPTAGLDSQMAYEVMEIAEQLNSSGVTVIMSSHDTDITYAWEDEIRVLHDGGCVYAGEPEPFYSDHRMTQAAGLMRPTVFMMNKAFADLGRCALEPHPRTGTQLSVKVSGCADKEFGSLYIVSAGPETDISGILESNGLGGMATGVYGSSARMAAERNGLSPDFMYNGPENCTMCCLGGKDAVLLCDPGMIGPAMSTVGFVNSNGYGKIRASKIDRARRPIFPLALLRLAVAAAVPAQGRPRA